MYGAGGSRMNPAIHSTPLRRHMPEIIVAIGLAVAPFILPHIGISEDLMTRILIWGSFGPGFDLLFGYTCLLCFGPAAFYGTGGFVPSYVLITGVSALW